MSMPKMPDISKMPTLEQALGAILTSIAMEEVAISHVLKAESEKIHYVVECAKKSDCGCADLQSIIAVNKSVADLVEKLIAFQALLKEKLAIVSKHIPPKPDPPLCTSIFATEAGYYWHKSMIMLLQEKEHCKNGAKLICKNGEPLILFPKDKNVELDFGLTAKNSKACPVVINLEFRCGSTVVRREAISQKSGDTDVKMSHKVSYQTSDRESTVAIRLIAPDSLSCVNAMVSVTVK